MGGPKEFRFKPGQSGNPKGRPKNPIPNALQKMTKQSYRRIIRAVCKGNPAQLQKLINDEKTSALEVAVAACFLKAIARGDYATVEQIASRILGKIPDVILVRSRNRNVNANVNSPEVPSDKIKAVLAHLEAEI